MARKSRRTGPERPEFWKEFPEKAVPTAVYARLSVEDGDDEEQNSIGSQKKIARAYLMEHPELQLHDFYTDSGWSGLRYDRPDLLRLMEDIRAGQIRCVLVKDVSRLGRHFSRTARLVERVFPALNVRFISINDGYDSAAKGADAQALTLPLRMVMNDHYVKDISRKVRSSISARMEKGEFLPASGSVPYGYLRDPEKASYRVDGEAAPVVLRMFAMRAEGASYGQISRVLNGEGVPCPGRLRFLRGLTKAPKYEAALWRRETVQKLLSDPVYTGKRIHGKFGRERVGLPKRQREKAEWRVIEAAHPAIVPEELFEKAQSVAAERRAKRENFRARPGCGQEDRELFRGKVFCADCGAPMLAAKGCARAGSKGQSHIFFECAAYRRSQGAACACHYLRQDRLHERVKGQLDVQLRLFADVDRLLEEIERGQVARRRAGETARAGLAAKKERIEARLEGLLADAARGVIDRDEYIYMKGRYKAQLTEAQREEREAEEKMKAEKVTLKKAREWAARLREYRLLPRLDRGLLDLLVERIEVRKDRSIRIVLRGRDPFRELEALNAGEEESHAD